MDAIYVRQSKYKEESLSLDMQIEFCRKITKGNDKVYRDAGISGKDTIHRPGFQQMIEDVEANLIDRVIVYRLDRFTRSILDFAKTWEILNRHKAEFISVTESFDTSTAVGKMCLFIIVMFAEVERSDIAARITDNYYVRARLGRWPGGPAPFGFDLKKLMVDDIEIPSLEANEFMDTVKTIYNLYTDPLVSLGTIQKMLNKMGILSPGGKKWTGLAIARLLRNPVYVKCDASIYTYFRNKGVEITNSLEAFTGEYGGLLIGRREANTRERKKIEETKLSISNWRGCIESDIWLQCQERLNCNHQIKKEGAGRNSWLSGLVKCGCCGYSMTVMKYERKDGITRYFYCSGKARGSCDCDRSPDIDTIEHEIERSLTHLLDKQKDCEFCISPPRQENELQIKILKIEEQIQNLISNMKGGLVSSRTLQYINEEIQRLTKEQLKISEQLEAERMEARKTKLENIDFPKLCFDEKKVVAMRYMSKINVFPDMIRIEWNV